MTDTLRSIVNGMTCECHHCCQSLESNLAAPCDCSCPKCRLLALIAEAEQVDLVKAWRDMQGCDWSSESDAWKVTYNACADELSAWLATMDKTFVNKDFVNRIKAEARLEEHDDYCVVCLPLAISTYPENRKDQCDRRAELEAQAKPEERR